MKEVLEKLRPFLPFTLCALAAMCLAYLLTRPLDYTSAFFLMIMAFLLAFPLLMRFCYPLFILSLLMPVCLFFLKGSPPVWMVMMLFCLSVSVIDRAITGKSRFVNVPQLAIPLLALGLVVFMTAELTGGLGFRALGGSVYGGRKYFFIFSGILAYFAITSRNIPNDKVRLYTALFLLGSLPSFVSDLVTLLPGGLHFIYMFIPPSDSLEEDLNSEGGGGIGVSRLGGVSIAAMALYLWLLARHGIQGTFRLRKPLRWTSLGLSMIAIGLGGFRSNIMECLLVFFLLFFLEKQHRTPLAVVLFMVGIVVIAIAIPFASKFPFAIQRSLSFLPLSLNPEAIASAQDSSNWRIDLWTSLLPQIPAHFWLGKGYGISTETYNEMISAGLLGSKTDASQQVLALAGDYHNGPISVILSFGIWGGLTFLWLITATLSVLWRNYKFGDSANLIVNRFLVVMFAAKLVIFMTVFGDIASDMLFFASYAGFSVAVNHGVCRRYVPDQSARTENSHPIKYKRPLPTAAPTTLSSAHPL